MKTIKQQFFSIIKFPKKVSTEKKESCYDKPLAVSDEILALSKVKNHKFVEDKNIENIECPMCRAPCVEKMLIGTC